MKIVVFDKYLGYQVGGAQNSLHTLLKNLKGDFEFLGCDVKKAFSAEKYRLSDWSVERMAIKEFPRFPYFEYWYNRKRIKKFIASQKADLLLTQGMWGAMAINAFPGKSIYFIRDEYHLNRIPNVRRGVINFLRKIYLFLQWPFISEFFQDNKTAVLKSDIVIANSKFIAEEVERVFSCKAEIVYPLIDIINMQLTGGGKIFSGGKFITCVGAEVIKGREIAEKIAEIMPNHKFMIVGRDFNKETRRKNIFYYPWSKNILEIYLKTKILLVPSLINEAFCRVAVEGMALGVPCLGSNKGGIPEVLGEEFIIKDLWNMNKWKEGILKIESNYRQYSEKLKKEALKFDAVKQVEKFKKIAKEKLNIDL